MKRHVKMYGKLDDSAKALVPPLHGQQPFLQASIMYNYWEKRWQKPHQCSLNMEKRKENEEQWVYHYPYPTASNTIISVCTVGIPTWDLLCTSKLSPKCTCCRTLSVWWALLSSSLPLGNLKSPTLKVKSIPKDCIFMEKKIHFISTVSHTGLCSISIGILMWVCIVINKHSLDVRVKCENRN